MAVYLLRPMFIKARLGVVLALPAQPAVRAAILQCLLELAGAAGACTFIINPDLHRSEECGSCGRTAILCLVPTPQHSS